MDAVAELAGALDRLCALDPGRLGDGDSVVALSAALDRLSAVTARAVAAFDAGRSWHAERFRSASAWVATRCHLPVPTARRRVQLGRLLRHLPQVEAAWLSGELSEAHVGLFAAVRTPATAACLARDESMLVAQAKTLRFGAFARVLAYWAQLADPDGGDAAAAAAVDGRRLHLSQTFGGCWRLDGLLDPLRGSIVAGMLTRIEQELFDADWAQAKAGAGEGMGVGDLARTPAQRRADALVEMARRAGAMPAGGRLPEPLFSVVVGYETFAGRICELANATVVAPGSLVEWLGAGWVERVVFDGPDRVMNVGVRRRIFSGATRRAIAVRDRQCFHPDCDEPAERCEIDHVVAWAQGGLTTTANGRVACGFHNRARQGARPPPGS